MKAKISFPFSFWICSFLLLISACDQRGNSLYKKKILITEPPKTILMQAGEVSTTVKENREGERKKKIENRKIELLLNKLKTLNKKLKELRVKNQILDTENEKLTKSKNQGLKEIDNLTKKINQLDQRISALIKKRKKSNLEKDKLKQENSKLISENSKLISENSKLKSEIAIFQKKGVPDEVKECVVKSTRDEMEIAIKSRFFFSFVKISSGVVDPSLSEEQAILFYQQAQRNSDRTTQPWIYRSISDSPHPKVFSSFWIQTETLSSEFYQTVLPRGNVNQISFQDSKKVLRWLNFYCRGKVQFSLPTEQQLVHVMRNVYNPVKERKQFSSCKNLRLLMAYNRRIKNLFAYRWQLTQSKCEPFGSSSEQVRQCNKDMVVKKGGSISSQDWTECLPEYRAESSPDTREPNTTLRLVAKLPKK